MCWIALESWRFVQLDLMCSLMSHGAVMRALLPVSSVSVALLCWRLGSTMQATPVLVCAVGCWRPHGGLSDASPVVDQGHIAVLGRLGGTVRETPRSFALIKQHLQALKLPPSLSERLHQLTGVCFRARAI